MCSFKLQRNTEFCQRGRDLQRLQYFISGSIGLLNNDINVQECDARMFNSGYTARLKKDTDNKHTTR